MTVKTPIYLDYQATTPLDPRVYKAMEPYFLEHFGNPHSITHRFGWTAEAAVEEARKSIAYLVGADPKAVYFTSGATEANNLAIKGVMDALMSKKPHMIVPVTEHKCVLEAARATERRGARVTWLGVDEGGLVDLNALEDAMTRDTALVSVMAVNNEIGVVQPLAEIGAICRAHDVYFHCDAAQAFGKIPIDVDKMKIDLLSVSGHKIYGPKGIGAVFIRRARPRVRLVPQMSGGGQEAGMRSGTLAPALCVGLGSAAQIAAEEMKDEGERIERMMRGFLKTVKSRLPDTVVNGDLAHHWWGNLNLSFPGLDGDTLLSNLRDLAVSSGAACASATHGPSYVLEAIGRSPAMAKSSIRFGIGRFTSEEETTYAADHLCRVIEDMGGLHTQAAE